jgi:malate dehydrogenase (oxaloacetate-decarboxylating)(NADP+)
MFAGAGSAGIGIANMLVEALVDEGLGADAARARIAMFDATGLLDTMRSDLNESQRAYAKDLPATDDLAQAVRAFKPTVLIGVSTTGGLFTEDVVKGVAASTDRPIIFPLSNPSDKAECTPEQAYLWTDGKALFAAGVQFPDVTVNGRTFHPGQANNFYVFPAFALAIYATRPRRIDDRMWIAAARGSADQVDRASRDKGMLFPKQDGILEVEMTTAARTAEHIFDRGLATVDRPDDILSWLKSLTYIPAY